MRLDRLYSGAAPYYPDHQSGPHRLFVAVSCRVEDRDTPVHALLDTGSEWCVLPPVIGTDLGLDLNPGRRRVPLHTRFGTIQGRLVRLRLHLVAEVGSSLEIEASCFVSQDWPGPLIIGWKGCLERIRFALDPGEDAFLFAEL